ncbi:unnamed protein product, partial [Ectocarpus sp. 13 AM-2016]
MGRVYYPLLHDVECVVSRDTQTRDTTCRCCHQPKVLGRSPGLSQLEKTCQTWGRLRRARSPPGGRPPALGWWRQRHIVSRVRVNSPNLRHKMTERTQHRGVG